MGNSGWELIERHPFEKDSYHRTEVKEIQKSILARRSSYEDERRGKLECYEYFTEALH
jgi:hypothetical protein